MSRAKHPAKKQKMIRAPEQVKIEPGKNGTAILTFMSKAANEDQELEEDTYLLLSDAMIELRNAVDRCLIPVTKTPTGRPN